MNKLKSIITRAQFMYFGFFDKLIFFINTRKHFGAFRFWLVRFIYKLNPFFPESRNKRFDFVLKYLPHLKMVNWIDVPALEIGCVDSLLLYEIKRRRYRAYGIDIRNYQSILPKDIQFRQWDITSKDKPPIHGKFKYIICLSVIELLGCGLYGDEKKDNTDDIAIQNIHDLLDDDGYFILSLPIPWWRGVDSRGYNFHEIIKLLQDKFSIIEMTQCGGHTCMALVKK